MGKFDEVKRERRMGKFDEVKRERRMGKFDEVKRKRRIDNRGEADEIGHFIENKEICGGSSRQK
jgi:hypothetical protein